MAEKQPKPSPLDEIIRKLNGSAEAALEVQLAQGGEHYYYSNFPAYREPLKEGLATIQQLLTTCESMVRTRRAPPPDWTDADEVAAWSSELLDDVVEKIDGALDAERARLRGREAGPRGQAASASAAAAGDASLAANLPSFGGAPVRPTRSRDPVRPAAGLARPQERFDPPPDNRREVPFRPRVDHLAGLTKEPCDPRVYQPTPGAPEDYPHPFAAELEALTYRPDQLAPPPQPPQPPPEPEDTPLVWVDEQEALAAMVSELSAAGELAVDLEHHSHRSFQGFTCLMQISTRTTDYVVDTLALRNQLGPALARVFADPRVVKVLHGADGDVEWLQRDFGLFLVNLFDTGQAARVLGLASCGLAFLLESICGVKSDKRFQMADWRVRPLTPEMMHYARCDTHYLLYVYDKLREQLAAVPDGQVPPSLAVPLPASSPGGALGLVLERSRQLCLKTYRKPAFSPSGYQDLLLRWQLCLSPQQTAVFAALLAWRDGVCRAEDEGTGYVLSKAQLVALAQAMPGDAKRLQVVLGRAMSEVAVRRIGELVAAINDAKHRPIQPPAAAEAAAPPAVGAAAAAAGAAAPQRAAPPALKPRSVAPIRTAAKANAAAATMASAPAPVPAPAPAPAAAPAVAMEAEVPVADAAEAAAAEEGAGAAAEAPSSRQAVGSGSGGGPAGEQPPAASPAPPAPSEEAASAREPADAAPPAATAAASGLKPRALKPPPTKSTAVSRSAALFGGVAASSAPAGAAGGAAGGAASGGDTSLMRSILGGGSSGAAGTAWGSRLAAQPPAAAAAAAGSSLAASAAAGGGGGGDVDEEERLAQQRAKRLRATFALPFMAQPAAAGAADVAAAAAGKQTASAADGNADAGAKASGAKASDAPSAAKPAVTAADIRAAVEAMRAEGEGTEIVMDADGRGILVPPGESGDRSGGAGAAPPPPGPHEAPQARTVAESDSDGDDDAGGDADVDASGGPGGGGEDRRVAGSELGLDVLDYVPVPLSQMMQKNKWDKGKQRRAQDNFSNPAGDGGGGKRNAGDGSGAAAPKRRRFTTEVAGVAAGGAAEQCDGESSSDGGEGSDSDGGHTVGPFAKKRPQKPPKKQPKQQDQAQVQAEPGGGRKAAPPGRRRGKPEPKGLMADFPRTNLVPAAPEGRDGGRGGGRGGRGGRRDGGRGGGRGGRQPTAFNPYDIPDEFLMKGGKRSAVMPRSGNRSSTFK